MQDLFIDRLKKNYLSITNNLNYLQKALPALQVSLIFLLTFLARFQFFFSLVIFTIWIFFTKEWKTNIIYFLFGSIFLLANPPSIQLKQPIYTKGLIEINEIRNTNKGIQYDGSIKGLLINEKYHYIDKKINFLLKNQELSRAQYIIEGLYIQKYPHFFTISKIKNLKKFSEQSFYQKIKLYLLEKLEPHLKIESYYKQGESLLLACLFGAKIPKEIKILFSKLGLSHILAISGFHFSIVAFFINSIFSLIFPKRIVQILLIIILTTYFIIIGSSSSIFRAYLCLLLGIIGTIFSNKKTALNLLLITFIFAFFLDPYSLQNAAFQLSYVATFGLIVFCPILENYLDLFLPKRTFKEAKRLNHFSAIFYIILQILKKIFCVNFSAFLFTLPIIFYHFQMISILGFIYNFFIPSLIGIGLTIGLIAFFLKTFLGISFLYLFVIKQLDELISFLFYYPRKLDFVFYQQHPKAIFTIFLELILIFWALNLYSNKKKCSIEKINLT